MRQPLVEKNLAGTYSDEMFKEQNAIIGAKIATAESILGQTIFDKYNFEDVERFMREKFEDLGKTYVDAEPGVRRVLLGSICPTGLSWSYSGLSNRQFSQEYQAIRDIGSGKIAMSTAYGSRTRDFRDESPAS